MAKFAIEFEGARESHFAQIRDFCKGKGVRVTKAWMSEIFTYQATLTVSCETKVGANKVRKFIWDEINGGAFCEIKKIGSK